MGLAVTQNETFSTETGKLYPLSWAVGTTHLYYSVAWGFGRKKDAEIALKVLMETDIDWDATEDEFRKQYRGFGGEKKIHKLICERLQW